VTTEQALAFGPGNPTLVGVLHVPDVLRGTRGVVVVVGGPQYRVGSHRQFVLLARRLADRGIPVLRFDHHGCGDSAGEALGFDRLDDDLRAAVDELSRHEPRLQRFCIWGLCDGASAALIYAARDPRVDRLVLLNPWVRSEGSLARAYLDNYYGRRLRNPAFWRKMITNPVALVRGLLGYAGNRRESARLETAQAPSFVERMLDGARAFRGQILVVLSGADTVAAEFSALVERDPGWRRAFSRSCVTTLRLDAANHTFSRREWRDRVAERSAEFVLG
jgi:exosortase A-associated hydrolase 1